MMLGMWPKEYLSNPNPYPDKSIEQIWDDLDGFSFEELYELPDYQKSLRFYVPLPPLQYQGDFIKGICFSQGAHLLIEQFPDIKKLFFVCANSMCSAYPWAHKADCFFTCYHNPKREKHYKKKYPETKKIIYIPLQDADFTDETVIAPTWERSYFRRLLHRLAPNVQKTIDVFCVSTAFPVKNIPVFAKALKVYEQKYGRRLKVVYAIGDRNAKKRQDGSLDYSSVCDYSKNVLVTVDKILGDTKSYIDFHPYIQYSNLPKYYSSAKCGVLASLIEGKNRFINECICCDTPVVVFKDLNKFSRGPDPVFFGNSGEYAPEFSPESLADTIHKVIQNPKAYEPRKNYLEYAGRRNFINTFLRKIPYYRKHLPNFGDGDALRNDWLTAACLNNYDVDFESFLYDYKCNISNVADFDNIRKTLRYYYAQFNIPWREIPFEKHKPIRD